jgi:hypothetical protein
MPKVWEETIKLRLPQSHGRSVGLHVSEVIRDLAFAGKILDEKWRTELAIEDQDTNMMQLGMAWEDYLDNSAQFPGMEYHSGELKVKCHVCARCGEDSAHENHLSGVCQYKTLVIYMSPDGLIWEDGLLTFLAEIKLTKKSCRDFAQGIRMGSKKSIMWIWQIGAYLKGTGTLAAKLLVMFVNGNYSKKPDDPEAGAVKKCYRLEFTEEEIESNWRMLENHAREMIRAGKWKYE